MALNCQMTLNTLATSAGRTPAPQATLQVYNTGASSVAVTGIKMEYYDVNAVALRLCVAQSMPALGPGQTTVVPSLSSVFFGPFPIVIASASSVNASQAEPAARPPEDPFPRQLAHPANTFVWVGATVTGSDGTINTAARAGLLVGPAVNPPLYSQGGVVQFNGSSNSGLVAVVL